MDCRAFGKTADNIQKYFSKGNSILIQGRLQFDEWTAQDSQKRSKHRITVETFQFLDVSDRADNPNDVAKTGDEETHGRAIDIDNIPF